MLEWRAASGQQAADRLAIRELIDAYAHCADRRDGQGQLDLFTADAYVAMFLDSQSTEPSQEFHGRAALAPVVDSLKNYDMTTHFNGQSTIAIDGDRATGETYCITYHLHTVDDQRMMTTMSVRYLDTFVKQDARWLFSERKLFFDWTEKRPSFT